MKVDKRVIYVLSISEIMDKFNIPKDKTHVRSHIEDSHSWVNIDDKLVLEIMW